MIVTLRAVQPADLPIFFAQQLDPEAVTMAAFSARDHAAFMQHWAKILGDDSLIKYCILADGQVAGNIVCFDWMGHKEVGYWLGKAYWGRGIATQALIALLQLVHERPLCAEVASHNVASLRVLQKCGFEIVDEIKDFTDENGEPIIGVMLKLG